MLRTARLLLCALATTAFASEDKLAVHRVDPPSWWASTGPSEITLLVEGTGLRGAKVTTNRLGVEIVAAECLNAGSSLFVDLKIAAGCAPGPVSLQFEGNGAKISREWMIEARSTYRPNALGRDDVIYLLMPDRFANGNPANDEFGMIDRMLDRDNPHAYHGGDFAGVKAKLPYLKDLGITAIWMTPVYTAAPFWFHTQVEGKPRKFADFHGYSPVDFYDTNRMFGTLDEYRDLVREAHKLGLKVIQDQIVGFTGPQHRWLKNPPAPGWFHGPIERPPSCNFRFDAAVNPHAKEADRRGLTEGWFFGILPDLDTTNPRVKRQVIQQSLWWAERFEADAIRLDTYPMVDRPFWRDWSKEQKALRPERKTIGEAWINDAADLSFFVGGRTGWDGVDPGIATVFDFPLNQAIVDVASNKASATKLGKALSRDFLFPHPEELVTFLHNHDTPRLSTLPNVSIRRHLLAAAFLLTARGIPQLTWGDEVNLEGHSNDRRSVPGAWLGDTRNTFTPEGRAPGEETVFRAYRDLLRLRSEQKALRRGSTTELISTDDVYAFHREFEGEQVVVVLNFGTESYPIPLPKELNSKRLVPICGSLTRSESGSLIVLPESFAILVP